MKRRSLLKAILFAPFLAWLGIPKPEHVHTWRFDNCICRDCGVTMAKYFDYVKFDVEKVFGKKA